MKDIDLVMSEGLGMRYAFIGPMETMHLNAPEGKVTSFFFYKYSVINSKTLLYVVSYTKNIQCSVVYRSNTKLV